MANNLIVSSEEYLALREILKLSPYVEQEDWPEARELVARLSREYIEKYDGSIPPPTSETVMFEKKFDYEDLVERAEKTANGLMNIGINGPRLGGWPREPSNFMCEAAETIRALLARDNK